MTTQANDGLPRVMLVCPVGDEIGGAEQVMLAVARGLPARGFAPVMAVMRPGRLAELARSQGIEAHAFPDGHRYRDLGPVLRATAWLTRLARQSQAVLMHATHTAHLYAAPAARWLGVPEVWHCHDTPSARDPVDRLQRLLRPAHAIFTTAAVAAGYPELLRGPHTTVAPSCVDPDHLRRQPPRPDVRDRLGLPASGPLLVTVARLQAHKGHPDLIDAAAIVLRDRPDATFVIVGKASTDEQERYRAELLARAERLGVAGRVRLVEFVDDADLAQLYRHTAALVHPAWSEGYGLVLLEAMGMGVPVVAAASAGPAEIVRDGGNGLLVPPRDPAALAAAVQRLLGDATLADRLRAGGTATADRLTLGHMMDQTADVYRRTLAARRPAAVP